MLADNYRSVFDHKYSHLIHTHIEQLPSAYPGKPFPNSSLSGKSMKTEGHLWREVSL